MVPLLTRCYRSLLGRGEEKKDIDRGEGWHRGKPDTFPQVPSPQEQVEREKEEEEEKEESWRKGVGWPVPFAGT